MRYLIKTNYYNLENKNEVIGSVYSIVESKNVKEAALQNLFNTMYKYGPNNSCEQRFNGKINGHISEIYVLEHDHTIGNNLVKYLD